MPPLGFNHAHALRWEFRHSFLLVVKVRVDIRRFVEEGRIVLKLLRGFITVAVKEFGVELFRAFGGFLVGSVVKEFQHKFDIFISLNVSLIDFVDI